MLQKPRALFKTVGKNHNNQNLYSLAMQYHPRLATLGQKSIGLWLDYLQFYILFNNISRLCKGLNERLYEMEPCLELKRSPR